MSNSTDELSGAAVTDAGRRRLILVGAMLATFMAAVESKIVGIAMPTIVTALRNFHLYSWVLSAYLLAQAVTVPLYGRLSGLYGRKRMFFLGTLILLTGSTLCSFARNMMWLIVFLAIQGLGAGAVQPG